MDTLIKFQQQSKGPINLSVVMNVDQKALALEMLKKMSLPSSSEPKPKKTAPARPLKPRPLREEISSDSPSPSEYSESSEEEEEASKFQPV